MSFDYNARACTNRMKYYGEWSFWKTTLVQICGIHSANLASRSHPVYPTTGLRFLTFATQRSCTWEKWTHILIYFVKNDSKKRRVEKIETNVKCQI
jgi:hypothetical protein